MTKNSSDWSSNRPSAKKDATRGQQRRQEGSICFCTGDFDCVITDLRMPGVDGRAVAALGEDHHQPDVDVIV